MVDKKAIVETTFGLTMRYGIRSVSMDDIARALGISKKTIYQHFENKKALVSMMVVTQIEHDVKKVESIIKSSENALDEMVKMARHILNFLKEMSPSMIYDLRKYYHEESVLLDDHYNTFVYTKIKNNLRRGIEEGYYLSEINAEIISRLYVVKCETVTNTEFFSSKKFKMGELYKVLLKYHLRGIVNDKGRTYLKNIEIE